MVLFLSDWAKYPNAIADFNTVNKSFMKLAALYKSMGVKNHAFLLALHDRTLVGVNPFDYANLSTETIMRIVAECRVNPWYFFREIVRVPASSGDDDVMLSANRGNIALFWYFFNHATIFLIQIRQTGKSLNSDILDCYLLNTRCTGTTINLLTKDDALRSVNIQRIKDIFSCLPWYINQRTKKDLDNSEVINISSLRNWYRTMLPKPSAKMALNVGRGNTAAIFKNDEGPFQPNARISIPAALAAGSDARGKARKNGEPYGTVFTTTVGKKDEDSGNFFYGELTSAAVHTEHYYDSENAETLEKSMRQASRTNIRTFKKDMNIQGEFAVNVTLNHTQLGKSDEWLRREIQDSKVSGDDANRDFFNIWTSGSLRSPFSPLQADKMRASEIEPMHVQIDQKTGFTVRWFVPMSKIDYVMKNCKTIVAVDTSDAAGSDDIGIRVTLDKTGQTIASCNINIANLLVFSDWFAHEWIVKYENTVSIIERRSSGIALIDHLLVILPSYGIDPFKRLFNRVVNEREVYRSEWEEINLPMQRRDRDIYVTLKKHFGFATSGSGITSRTDLYGTTMSSAVQLVGDVIYDKVTIDQILGLVQKNGRIDHAPGEHDDMCFVGSTLVRTIDGNRPIKDIKIGDLVLTRKGYRPVIKLFCSEKEVITQYGLTGTANHPFITPSGEVQFKDLQKESIVYTWNEKLSSIETKSITDILTQQEPNIETISTGTTKTMNRQSLFIDKSMKIHTDQYRKVTSFTTKTTTTATTQLKIWKQSHKLNTLKSIQCQKKKDKDAEKKVKSVIHSILGEKKTQSWLVNKPKKMAQNHKVSLTGEKIIQSLQRKSILKLEEKAQKQEKRKETVYNLMVEDCHEYFVNDILVHNCIGWLLGHWLLTQGKNLHHYGLNVMHIFSDIKQKDDLTDRERYENTNQSFLKTSIQKALEGLATESDPFIIERKEHHIRMMQSQLNEDDIEMYSIDELILKAKEIRKKRMQNGATKAYNPDNMYAKMRDITNTDRYSTMESSFMR